jgi:hypothetical protein
MYLKKIKIFLLPFLLCSAITASAQDVREDLRRVNRQYEEAEKLSMSLTYTLYPSPASKEAEKTYAGFYRKDGQNIHSKLMDTETLQNASYTVMADEENKILLLSAPGKKGFAPGQQDLDKYLAYCSSVKFTEDKTYKIYTLAFKKGTVEFSEIVLYIDKKSYLFGKMTVYMHPSKELTESGYAEGQATARSKPIRNSARMSSQKKISSAIRAASSPPAENTRDTVC